MKTFTFTLYHGGHLQHQAQHQRKTAAEILFLKHTHGQSSVKAVVEDGVSDISQAELRLFLHKRYGEGRVKSLFGEIFNSLPEDLTDASMAGGTVSSDAELEATVNSEKMEKKAKAEKSSKAEKKREKKQERVAQAQKRVAQAQKTPAREAATAEG